MKSFSVTTKNLTDRPYLSHKSADNLSEDLPLLSVSVSLKMARMDRPTDIHNLPPYRGCLCSAFVGPQGGGRQNLPDSQSAPKLLHIPYPEVQNTMG